MGELERRNGEETRALQAKLAAAELELEQRRQAEGSLRSALATPRAPVEGLGVQAGRGGAGAAAVARASTDAELCSDAEPSWMCVGSAATAAQLCADSAAAAAASAAAADSASASAASAAAAAVSAAGSAAVSTAEVGIEWQESVGSSDPSLVV